MFDEDLLFRAVPLLAALLGGTMIILALRKRGLRTLPAVRAHAVPTPTPIQVSATTPPGSGSEIPWEDPFTAQLTRAVHGRAFGAANFHSYLLTQGEHAEVMARVREGIPEAATRREYFTRKPHVVPRLLSAMRNSDSSLKELVEIIMADPVMTGDVIRMANSAYYRASKEPIESIGRAVVTLGMDGLRAVVANSVMQPVFQVPRGYFEAFSPTVWCQAQHAAVAAQAYARATQACDSFAAHLLALLFHMSHIVLFRMTVASYLKAGGSLPRADVFACLIDECAEPLARDIATEWELPAAMIEALVEHVERRSIDAMTPLARALYFGRICGAAKIALDEGVLDDGQLLELLARKGLAPEHAQAVWSTTKAFEDSAD